MRGILRRQRNGVCLSRKNVENRRNTKCGTDFKENETEIVKIGTENVVDFAEILNAESDGRLTESDDLGNWGVKGLLWKNLYVGQAITREIHDKLYGCLYKLMQYEETGLSPEEVERQGAEVVLLDNQGEYHFCTCGKPAEDNMGNGYNYCPNCGRRFIWKEAEDR